MYDEPTPPLSEAHKKWAEWSPRPKRKKVELIKIVSVLVLVTSAVQLTNIPGI